MSKAQQATSTHPHFLLTLLNIIALLGVGVSVSLAQHFYEIRNGTAAFKTFCNISQAFNCDIVAASRYAEFIPGVPLASLVSGWFLALFFISVIARNPYWFREA